MNEIKAQELRIGNLVNLDNEKYHSKITAEKKPLKVVAISMTKGGYSVSLNSLDVTKQDVSPLVSQYLKFIKPIPLTDEWMIKFGLNIGQKYFPIFKEDDRFFYKRSSGFNSESFIELEHVHQLQNLFYSLSGEELSYE